MQFMKFTINQHNQSSVANCLQVAADRFKENAATFRQLAATGGNGMFTVEAAKQMAEQFDRQAVEASAFGHVFQSMELPLEILYDHDEEDDENPFHPESPEGREWSREFKALARA